MWLTFLFRCPKSDSPRPRRPRTRQPWRHFLPRLESLEDRVVPSNFTVRNLADSGPGSLRQTILDANAHPGANITRFASSLQGTIPLTGGELEITGDLTIDGPAEDRLTVSGNHASRLFDISASASVTIVGLIMTDGLANGTALV